MTTFNTIAKPKINFTMVPNEVLIDRRLSLKAKGLWAYFLSRPEGWKFSVDRLCSTMKEGKKSIQSAIKELEEANYLERKARYDDGSKTLGGYQYTLKFDTSDVQNVSDTKGVRHESRLPQNGVTINKKDTNNMDNKNIDSSSFDEEPKSSPSDEKIIEKSKEEKSVINKYYKKAIDEYFDFYKEKNKGQPPKFSGAEGNALKSILAYFRSIAEKEKSLEEKCQYSLDCIGAIFDKNNWKNLSDWQQKNPDIKIINSHLNNIINTLKNGKSINTVSKVPRKSSDWVD